MDYSEEIKNKFLLYEYVPVGICVINNQFEILYWNNNIEDWTELRREEVLGRKLYDFYPNFMLPFYKSRLDIIFEGGPPTIFSSQLHKNVFGPYKSKNLLRVTHTTVSAIPDDNGNEFFALFAVEDLTEQNIRIRELKEVKDLALEEVKQRTLAEESLKQSQQQLQELNATKDKFFSIIAHDIRNPLGVCLSVSEFVLKEFSILSREDIFEFMEGISKSARGLHDLLENLLTWSRSQTGKISFNPDYNSLAEVAYNIIGFLKPNADKKEISLIVDIPDNLHAFFDINMINTVIRNLVSNAIKFTPNGGRILVSTEELSDNVIVSVSDNGVGIDVEDIPKLFRIDIHHSTRGTSEESGTGLGLILCQEFVETNNGKIWVESKVNEGSIFKFTLPKGA